MEHANTGARSRARPPLFMPPISRAGIALVVSTCHSTHGVFVNSTPEEDESNAIWGLIAEGYDPQSIYSIGKMPKLPFSIPRSVRWADLPMIMAPQYDYASCHIRRVGRGFTGTSTRIGCLDPNTGPEQDGQIRRELHASRLESVKRLHVVHRGDDDEMLWHAIAPVFSVNPDAWISVSTQGENRFLESEECTALAMKFKAHDHFLYNHVLNMSVIGARAFFEAASITDTPRRHAGHYLRPDMDNTHVGFGYNRLEMFSPLTIQLIIALAEMFDTTDGYTPVADDYSGGFSHRWQHLLRERGVLRGETDCECYFVWKGTGKFAEAAEPLRDSVFSMESLLDDILRPLVKQGILHYDGVTHFGRAVATALGNKARDADVLLRWRTSDGRLARSDDMPSIDRWLVKYFRTLKRQVSSMRAAPFTELQKHWMPRPQNELTVRGVTFDISGMESQERREVAARILAEVSHLPEGNRTQGVIYDEKAVFPEEEPLSIWRGIPLRSRRQEVSPGSRFNSGLDTADIDRRVLEMCQLVKDAFHLEPSELRFIRVPTSLDGGYLVQLKHRFDETYTGSCAALYFGKRIVGTQVHAWMEREEIRDVIVSHAYNDWNSDHGDWNSLAHIKMNVRTPDKSAVLFGKRIGMIGLPYDMSRRYNPSGNTILDDLPAHLDIQREDWDCSELAIFPKVVTDVLDAQAPVLWAVTGYGTYQIIGDPETGQVSAKGA